MRNEYTSKGLHKEDLDLDPFKQFETWFNNALEAQLLEPNAMVLATVGKDMMPSTRVVLLKLFDKQGFVFFTNYTSKKAEDIAHNPKVSLHFAWYGLERQVKIEGIASKISKGASLKYFLSRPKGSQIGAWVSHQSKIITSRSLLEQKFDEMKNKFASGEVPFPSFWGGYCVKPLKIEFWQGQLNRLHDRFVYDLQDDNTWQIQRLAP